MFQTVHADVSSRTSLFLDDLHSTTRWLPDFCNLRSSNTLSRTAYTTANPAVWHCGHVPSLTGYASVLCISRLENSDGYLSSSPIVGTPAATRWLDPWQPLTACLEFHFFEQSTSVAGIHSVLLKPAPQRDKINKLFHFWLGYYFDAHSTFQCAPFTHGCLWHKGLEGRE